MNHSAQRGSSKITEKTVEQHAQARTYTHTHQLLLQQTVCGDRAAGNPQTSAMRKQILADDRLRRRPPPRLPPAPNWLLVKEAADRAADRVGRHSVSEEMLPEQPVGR